MAPRFRPVLLVTLIAGSIAGTAAAQEVAKPDSAAKADTTAAPVDETIGLKLGALPLYLTGYVTSTFTYSFAATDNILVGRFYDRYQKQFMANAAELGITKPVDTGKLDAGARIELLFGQDAAVTQSAGLQPGQQRGPYRGLRDPQRADRRGRPLDPVQAGQDVDDHGLRGDR